MKKIGTSHYIGLLAPIVLLIILFASEMSNDDIPAEETKWLGLTAAFLLLYLIPYYIAMGIVCLRKIIQGKTYGKWATKIRNLILEASKILIGLYFVWGIMFILDACGVSGMFHQIIYAIISPAAVIYCFLVLLAAAAFGLCVVIERSKGKE